MASAGSIVSMIGGYWSAQPCDKLDFIISNATKTLELYPACATFYSGENPGQYAAVMVNMINGGPEQAGAALNINFGAAGWLALALHAIGVEIYVSSRPPPLAHTPVSRWICSSA